MRPVEFFTATQRGVDAALADMARRCWHCCAEIHPLDAGHAARCATEQAFAAQNVARPSPPREKQ